MAKGQGQQITPVLATKEIQSDVYVRQNFQNLVDYFTTQNQLVNFNFFEYVATKAISNFKLAHQLGFQPTDIICTQITGTGSVSFNLGLSDATFLNISTSDACRVRFFVGRYWNQISNVTQKSTDIMTFAAQSTSSSLQVKDQKIVKVATYNALTTDAAIFADCSNGPITVILPATTIADQISQRVQKIDSTSNILTVKVNNPGQELIRTTVSVAFSTQWSGGTFYCVKPNWYY